MPKNSEDTSSLKGYDIILSISEEAINRQLRTLYWTAVRKPIVPTDSQFTGPPAPTKYLINHDLSIHLKDENGDVDEFEGIEAHIDPPTVSFTNLWGPTPEISERVRQERKEENDFHSARISIKFIDDPKLPRGATELDDKKGSYFQYSKKVKNKKAYTDEKLAITGYTMSWTARLARTDISDVMTKLIGPAKDETLPDYLPDAIKKKWTEWSTVDNRKFLVSSLFCLFTADEIVRTFELRNKDGLEDDKLKGVASTFITSVSRHFSGLKSNSNGMPTPDNPFVLGYGISQQIPEVWRVVNEKVINPPPRFLQPKEFHFSTTPSPAGPVKGTLNFCIETLREPPRCVDPMKDKDAGIFAVNETLFASTKSKTGDGVLAFSKDLFMKRYISDTFAPQLILDVKNMLNEYLKYWDDKPTAYSGLPKGYMKYDDKTTCSNDTSYSRKVEFQTCGAPQEGTAVWYGADFLEGSSIVDIKVSSDLMSNKHHAMMEDDWKRRTFIDVDIKCDFWSRYYTMPKGLADDQELLHDVKVPSGWEAANKHPDFLQACMMQHPSTTGWNTSLSAKVIARAIARGLIQAHGDMPNWAEQRWSHVDVAYRIRYVMEPADGGAWAVTVDPALTNLPVVELQADGTSKPKVEQGNRNGRYGAFVDSNETNWLWKKLAPGHYLESFNNFIKEQVSIKGVKELAESISKNFDSMNTTVFLPAGNVFQFRGLDVDESGKLYSHISYAQGAASAQQIGDAGKGKVIDTE